MRPIGPAATRAPEPRVSLRPPLRRPGEGTDGATGRVARRRGGTPVALRARWTVDELLALLGQAQALVGDDGSPLPLVLRRLGRARPEDARARAAVGALLAERAGQT